LELFEEKAEKFYVFGQLSEYLNLADMPEEVRGTQKRKVKKVVCGEGHALILLGKFPIVIK